MPGPGGRTRWSSPPAEDGLERADAVVERITGEKPLAACATIVAAATNVGSCVPTSGVR
ncbi:MAG TPA: hypothetical protein PLP50_12905 [Thermoanaerobaculia bacterium]|nr:hypothetical protein [Thermoanaerobaculia bacterium]HQN06386.1 hypothetical protein [Thermoanaerobaculia bacterium]HQP85653.1 hypothetical protein [Thermoanaerobaculia bacterium]